MTNSQIATKIESKEIFNELEGMELLKAIVANCEEEDDKEMTEEEFNDWLFGYEDEDYKSVYVAPKVVKMTDVSICLETELFITEFKKATKYILHCKNNPIKNTNSTIQVGTHCEYSEKTVSLYSINTNRRNRKLNYANSVIEAKVLLSTPFINDELLDLLLEETEIATTAKHFIRKSFDVTNLFKDLRS